MAEFIFKSLVREKGIEKDFYVSSSATSTEEIWGGIGNPVYPPAKAELARHGIDCEGKRAVQLTRADAEKYDIFIGMDSANIRNMHRILGEGASDRIFKLMSFAGRDADVSDPWYSDRFDVAYRDIYEGCEALLNSLIDR
jgi:protein-tyrosine phosphatase